MNSDLEQYGALAQHVRERCCGTCLCKMDVADKIQELYEAYVKLAPKEENSVTFNSSYEG